MAERVNWKRKYEGMVKERDDQIYRKRESRRILTERAPLDAQRLADAMQNHQNAFVIGPSHRYHCGGTCAAWIAAEYNRLSEATE